MFVWVIIFHVKRSILVGNVNVMFKVGAKVTQCLIKNIYLIEKLNKNLLSVSTMDSAGYRVV